MLLDRYEFHDLYAVLVAFRSNPQAEYNIEITKAIISVLEKQQDINLVEFNIFRNALKSIEKIDKERFYWVYINNAYTYGHRVEKNEFYYSFGLYKEEDRYIYKLPGCCYIIGIGYIDVFCIDLLTASSYFVNYTQTKIRSRMRTDFCLYYSLFIFHHSLFIKGNGFSNE